MEAIFKGIDVCGYQGTIDFKKVKANGVDVVIIKAGAWLNTVPSWEENFANAKNNGMRVGAYWYSYANSIADLKREVQAFIAALKGKQLDFPVYLDLEESSQFNKGKAFCTEMVEVFCTEMRAAGYFPGVYCSTYWYTAFVEKSTREKYPAWIADYRGKCYYEGEYGIWQYDSAYVPGVQFDCDRDWVYVDYAEEIKKDGWNNYSKAIVSPEVKKTVDELAHEVINGMWGNGQERKDKLTVAGYSYDDVQARVNEILYKSAKTDREIAQEVIDGKWGNGNERFRLLTDAGRDYYRIQRIVNEILYTETLKSIDEIAQEVIQGKWGYGQDRCDRLTAAGYSYDDVQKRVNEMLYSSK